MVIILALIPFTFWAIGDIFGTISSKKIGNIPTNVGFLIFSFVLLSLYIPFAGGINSLTFFMLALLLGGLHVLGLFTYFKGLEIGNASIVGSIVGSFAASVVIFSVLIFHEMLGLKQLVGVVLAILGVIITSFNFRDISLKKMLTDKGSKYALITFLLWGLYFTLIRIPIIHIGWFWTLYPATFYFLPTLFIPKIQETFKHKSIPKKILIQIGLMACFGRTGDLAYNLALTKGYSSVVGSIAGASPILFVILARIFFKQKMTLQQTIGVCISICGIILLSVASL